MRKVNTIVLLATFLFSSFFILLSTTSAVSANVTVYNRSSLKGSMLYAKAQPPKVETKNSLAAKIQKASVLGASTKKKDSINGNLVKYQTQYLVQLAKSNIDNKTDVLGASTDRSSLSGSIEYAKRNTQFDRSSLLESIGYAKAGR